MITIMLADDHQVVRQGLRAILEADGDFSVVAESALPKYGIEAKRST